MYDIYHPVNMTLYLCLFIWFIYDSKIGNRKYFAPQNRNMNIRPRFNSEVKVPFCVMTFSANHSGCMNVSANQASAPLFRLFTSFGYLRDIFQPSGLKYFLS